MNNDIENMDDTLKYAVENGILDISYVQEMIEMNKRKELLSNHKYKIWQGKDNNWYTYLPDERKGRILKKRTSRKSIEDEVIKYWKTQMENPTIQNIFNEWNDRRRNLKKIDPATHLRYLKDFERFYGKEEGFGQKRIKAVKREEISMFLEEQISKHNLAAKAFSNLKCITKGMLKYAKRLGYISFNIEEMFYDMDVSDSEFKKDIKEDCEEVFSEDETPVIMEYLVDNKDIINLGILLMFVTGIRVGELAALKWVDYTQDSLKIRRTETKYNDNNGKPVYAVKDFPKTQAGVRTAVIPKDYIWIIQSIRNINPFGEYMFVSKGERIRTYKFRKRLYLICRYLKLPKRSCHKIRKTYGTILLDNHIDNRLIMNQMGHTDIKCTEERYHRNRRTIEKKIEIISAISEFKQCGN